MTIPPAIEAAQLAFSYGEHQALRGISFDVHRGEIFGLLGPNGGGKTTVFRLLSTLLPLQTGSVRILDRDLATDPAEIRRRIGITFQSPSVDVRLTVYENLRYQGMLYGLHGADLERRMDQVLADLGIRDRARDRVENLSGGLKRRVEIAKGLLHDPQVLLLDEPSTGLDPGARQQLWHVLQTLREQRGVTILLTTHLMDEAERCDRLAILNRGELIALGTPGELRSRVGGDCVVFETPAPDSLAELLEQMTGRPVQSLAGSVRIEIEDGATVLQQVLTAHSNLVERASVGRPTLEDVFIHLTGHEFWEATE